VFLVPWPDHWLIGTTDAPFEGPAARPSAAGWEVDRLLDTVNATMNVGLTRADVVGTYAGLRPLIAPSDGSTVKASREHRVTVEPSGVVRIGGGKYTTYRVMARDVIDAVLGPAGARERPSDTADRRLIGAADTDALARIAGELSTIAAIHAVGPETAARLVARHGTEAPAVVALGAELDLIRPLVPGRSFLEAEVAWAVRHELAESLDDVLARRTRLAQELPDRGAAIAPRVAEIMAADLDWGEARQALEVDGYLAFARREFSVAASEVDAASDVPAAVVRDVEPAAVD
jgi:glycerol-3-phosphate dehydrogenase